MNDHFSIKTNRLLIEPLTINDDHFIFELVNTEGWLQFIGNRNITSVAEAGAYIQTILENQNITYWVVRLSGSENKIGIVTFIKRDYLQHPDLGFAFLPQFCNKGYAYEAASAVLQQLFRQYRHPHILATTVPHNMNSIRLLEKMRFVFEEEMEIEKVKILVYKSSVGVSV